MGMITFGIPERIALELSTIHGVSVFIETGTYHGQTAKWASAHFDEVHTIEQSTSLFDTHSKALENVPNIKPYCGDSRDILPAIVDNLGDRKAMYWLDSHWFGGETAGQNDQCPLLGELQLLAKRTQDIILIDDARLILTAPPMPHNPSYWPTIADVVHALPDGGKKSCVQVVDDVIFIVPDEEPVKSRLITYTKRRSNLFWQDYQQRHHKMHST
jgi:hypothetical protein